LLNQQKLNNMFIGTLVKQNSKIGYVDKTEKLLYDIFIDKVQEGEELEIFVCRKGSKASVAQISKVHACIRELSMELGFTFADMKLVVKQLAGLYYEAEEEGKMELICKSFATCSKDEITLAIEACKQIAQENNIILE